AWIPNITQQETGLKTWSAPELVAFLSGDFFAPHFDPAGNRMAEVVKNLSELPRQDIEAIAGYVLTLPSTESPKIAPPLQPIIQPSDIDVKMIAHEWWWEIRYGNTDPSRIITTANDLHIPV